MIEGLDSTSTTIHTERILLSSSCRISLSESLIPFFSKVTVRLEFSTIKHDCYEALYKLSRMVQFGLFTLDVGTRAIFSLAEEALKFENDARVGRHNIFRYSFCHVERRL